MMHYDPTCDIVVAVGSGVMNDIGKIVANVTSNPYVIVGTAPSMDGYASGTSSMAMDGLKVSLPSACANVIIGDIDILKEAPKRLLQAGLGDMLAKYVSICEWRIANLITGEYYCETIAQMVRDALKKCADNAEGLLQREEEAIKAVFEGLIRVIIFVVYMALVARMKEIHRVYMYHGAEHKTIFCFEHGKELTVENIKKELRYHPRCGTAFIFVTILLSIIVSSVVSVAFPELTANRAIWIAVKLLIMPLIMGIGFEFIQLAGKYPNKLTKLLSAPGLLMQRITTEEPDDAIIEVAIEAMNACLSGKVSEKTENDAENEE